MFWLATTVVLSALTVLMVRRQRVMQQRLTALEGEIEELRRRGIEFVANVSHELKTPLTSIMGYTETLRSIREKRDKGEESEEDRKKASEFLDRILENTDRLGRLIHDILDLSRIEQPNVHLEKAPFSLAGLFEELQMRFAHRLEIRKQFLKVPDTERTLLADRWLVDQALNNLVENAHRYCPEGALIEIALDEVEEGDRKYVAIHVIDNGPGIVDEDLPRIFERFYRAEKSRNRLFGGTGLGLAIVKHIMMSHGGLTRVESRVGQGSRFSLYFPS